MRLSRVWFTLRRLRVAVAVTIVLAAFAAGIVWLRNPQQVRLRRLRMAYIAKAEHHAELERNFTQLSKYQDFFKSHATVVRGGRLGHMLNPQLPELVPGYVELAKYHGSLKEKYEHDADHPRLPVALDPPEPPVPE